MAKTYHLLTMKHRNGNKNGVFLAFTFHYLVSDDLVEIELLRTPRTVRILPVLLFLLVAPTDELPHKVELLLGHLDLRVLIYGQEKHLEAGLLVLPDRSWVLLPGFEIGPTFPFPFTLQRHDRVFFYLTKHSQR